MYPDENNPDAEYRWYPVVGLVIYNAKGIVQNDQDRVDNAAYAGWGVNCSSITTCLIATKTLSEGDLDWNLEFFNCTHAAIDMAGHAGVSVPAYDIPYYLKIWLESQ